MDFGLTDDQREIQRTARELLAERARPERVREHAEAGTTDQALWSELCELGWPGIAVAEENGGQGLGRIELSILCEELGRSLAPVPFLPTVMAATLIEHAGSPQQRERWLPGLGAGESRGALGMALDGVAELVIGAPEADVIVLVEEDRSGRVIAAAEAEVIPIASIDSTRSTARVIAADDAGEPLSGDIPAGLDRSLVAVSSELVGVCERALEMTVAYVKERKQFGVPVGTFQAVQHKAAQMLLDVEGGRSATYYAAWSADASPDLLPTASSAAKAWTSDRIRDTTASAIQLHGGIGFTWEADVHWWFKRAQLDAHYLGSGGGHRARISSLVARQRAGATA
jgi:alkylation response protein AidB-like acyl-CoA dehydrogenase